MKEFKNSILKISQILLLLLGITAVIFSLIWVFNLIKFTSTIIYKHLEVNWLKYLAITILIYISSIIISEFRKQFNRTDINFMQKIKQAFIESLREFHKTLIDIVIVAIVIVFAIWIFACYIAIMEKIGGH